MAVFNMTGGGTSKPEQEKSVTVTSNGTVVIMPDTGKVLSKATAIVNVPGGGGAHIYLALVEPCVLNIDTYITIHSDTELLSTIGLSDMSVSNNVTGLTFVDSLNITLTVTNLSIGDTISVQILSSGYKHNNGSSEVLNMTVATLTFSNLLNDTKHMTIVRDNVKMDSGDDTCVMSNTWPGLSNITRPACNTFKLNGDSYVTINDVGHADNIISINRLDAAVWSTWKQEGVVQGLNFIKLRWLGASYYNGSIDTCWEIVFLSNGDAYVNLIRQGTNWSGTFSFFGETYTLSTASPLIAFYREDYIGTSFRRINELYDISHHITEADTPWPTTIWIPGQLSALYLDYDAPHVYRNNVKNDDGTDTIITKLPWFIGTSTTISVNICGNSWIGLGSTNENIRMNRRDAAVYYEKIRYSTLTDQNNLHAMQVIWGGSASYSGAIDQWWSLWLFENGDAMIHIKQLGTPSEGTSYFYSTPFTAATDAVYSFYRNDAAATSWTMETGLYDVTHHRL